MYCYYIIEHNIIIALPDNRMQFDVSRLINYNKINVLLCFCC